MGTTVVGAGCTMTCVVGGGGGLLHAARPTTAGKTNGKKWITRILYSIKAQGDTRHNWMPDGVVLLKGTPRESLSQAEPGIWRNRRFTATLSASRLVLPALGSSWCASDLPPKRTRRLAAVPNVLAPRPRLPAGLARTDLPPRPRRCRSTPSGQPANSLSGSWRAAAVAWFQRAEAVARWVQ